MRLLAAVLLSLVVAATHVLGADADYAAPGRFAVREIDVTWTDPARHRDVPLRIRLPAGQQRLPTILFSHGLGGSTAGGQEWGEQWASRGFAVIHVQHPGSDESLWKDKPASERWSSLWGGANVQQFLARVADIKFVVAELGRRQAAGDALVVPLDLDRLGMSGHSFGAITTLYLGGQRLPVTVPELLGRGIAEPRFKAFLAFSPQAIGKDAGHEFARFPRPALLVTGTLDNVSFGGVGTTPADRLLPFEAMAAAGNKFLLVVEDADHRFFNGVRGMRDYRSGRRTDIDFAAVEQRGYRLIKSVSTAYWLAYLADDAAAMRWLKDGDAAADAESDGTLRRK